MSVFKNSIKSVSLTLVFLGIVGCAPDEIETEIYVGDVTAAIAENEVLEVPITVAFSILGDDKENLLPRAVEAVKPFVHPDTEFAQSKGQFGERLVVNSFIPMGTPDAVNTFGTQNSFPFAILVSQYESGGSNISFVSTDVVGKIDQQLSGLNMMLGLEGIAKNTKLRVVNDLREPATVYGTAVFVSKKPYLYFDAELSRRESVEIIFKGGDGSVYSEIAPEVDLVVDSQQ